MVKRKKDPVTGKFTSDSEPNEKSLTFRLSENLLQQLKLVAGDQTAAFIREAIMEKMEREFSNNAHESKENRTISNQVMVSL